LAAVTTDAAGKYTTPPLAVGGYFAKAGAVSGYVDEVYRELACITGCDVRLGTKISVAANVIVPGIDFTLSPLAAIAGTATNPAGNPVANAPIAIYASDASLVKTVNTGADGRYAATGLQSGLYFAHATNPSGFSNVLFDAIACASGCDISAGTKISTTVGLVATANFRLPDASEPRITPTLRWTNPGPMPQGVPLDGTQLNASAHVPGTFVYNPPAGTVLPAGAGQMLSVTFTPDDTATYTTATTTATIDVGASVISWTPPAPIVFGTRLGVAQLNATANVPGTFVYSPPFGTQLNAGAQVLSVTFTPLDPSHFPVAMASVPLNVLKSPVTVTWRKPEPLIAGIPLSNLQLNATASVAGTFVYSPPAGTVLPAGLGQTISLTFTPTNPNFAAVTTAMTIDVLSPTGQFAGHVTDSVTGLPLENVNISAYNLSGASVATATTDAFGQFTTLALANGFYYGTASAGAGYVDQLYDKINCVVGCAVTTGTRISVPPGLTNSGVNFFVAPRGAIVGTVADTGSHPLAGVTVSVYDSAGALLRTASTDAAGHYSVSGLATANYFARTTNVAGYDDVLFNAISCASGCDVTTGTPISTTIGIASIVNFALPGNTPPGSSVSVSATDAATGETASVTFSTVTAAGQTTLTVSDTGPAVPDGFQFGAPPLFFDVSTTATYTAPVTSCFSYAGISFADPSLIRLLHFEGGVWNDVTSSIDATNQIVCGSTASLSPFAIAQVLRQTPVINWANPADLVYGTALGATQLNATAGISGTFAYS